MGGLGRAGDAAPVAVAAIWRAAADALAWTASMRDHTARTERRKAWAARSEAAAAMGRVAEECAAAIDADGGADAAAAMSRAVETERGAAAQMRLAAEAFRRSSRHHSGAKADQDQAAQAYERAAEHRRSRTMGERAERSQANVLRAGEMASGARAAAKALARNAGRLEAIAAALPRRGHRQAEDGDELASLRADMLDDAGRASRQSSAMEKQAVDAERLAAEVRGLAAAAAEHSMTIAAVASEQGLRDPQAKEAAAALRGAAASAGRLAAAERQRMENQAE